MTTKARTRAKGAALGAVPQTREEVAAAIGRVGELLRRIEARRAEADQELAHVGERLHREVAQLGAELDGTRAGIQAWCEAHRDELTNGGRVKSAQFGTGAIRWRARPPKVTLRGVKAVIEAVQGLGLSQFLRTTVEVNKEAMLADPETARAIAGVTISSDGEDFVIEPAEVEVGA